MNNKDKSCIKILPFFYSNFAFTQIVYYTIFNFFAHSKKGIKKLREICIFQNGEQQQQIPNL